MNCAKYYVVRLRFKISLIYPVELISNHINVLPIFNGTLTSAMISGNHTSEQSVTHNLDINVTFN